MKNMQFVRDKKQKAKKLYIFFVIPVLLSVISAGLSVVGYKTYYAEYQRDFSLAQLGMQHLRTAEMLLKALPNNPFDAQTASQAQHEFVAASNAFVQVNDDLKSLPGMSTSIPVYGPRLRTALDLLPLAIELSQAGVTGCNVLNLLISRFHNPLNTSSQGITMADFSVIANKFHQVNITLNLALDQFNHEQPDDLQIDPGLGKYFVTFQKEIPLVQTSLETVEKLLPIIPTLLGIGKPTNYLIEVLDSSELRPGGGFLGSYGIATLTGGRLTSAHITDTYLLDKAYRAAGHIIPLPSAYSWFDIAPDWSLRDSNLEADFPTSARYAEENYLREGGKVPVQGVLAITPAFIQQTLEITGPIYIPEYDKMVTSQNLVDLIHYYLLGPGYQGGSVPSPDGLSSVNQHFVALLAEHLLARVRQLPSSALPKLLQLMIGSVHSKDLQIYLNMSIAESLLQTYHLDASIQSPAGDSLFVVDANIGGDKANNVITNTLVDQVTIDTQGNAIHHTTIRYAWTRRGSVYGSPLYRDYVRVYIPPHSMLQKQDGWQPRGTSQAFDREVWAGFFTLSYGRTNTITLIWKVPGVATKDVKGWHYQYLIQHQAGSQWTIDLQMKLPACAVVNNKWGGLVSSNTHTATLTQSLIEDMNLGEDYVCR
jgi:hypothetical protein